MVDSINGIDLGPLSGPIVNLGLTFAPWELTIVGPIFWVINIFLGVLGAFFVALGL